MKRAGESKREGRGLVRAREREGRGEEVIGRFCLRTRMNILLIKISLIR